MSPRLLPLLVLLAGCFTDTKVVVRQDRQEPQCFPATYRVFAADGTVATIDDSAGTGDTVTANWRGR